MGTNYFSRMITTVIDSMRTSRVDWPVHWDSEQKVKFLDDCLQWLEENELYEQCEIIINEKKKIKK